MEPYIIATIRIDNRYIDSYISKYETDADGWITALETTTERESAVVFTKPIDLDCIVDSENYIAVLIPLNQNNFAKL